MVGRLLLERLGRRRVTSLCKNRPASADIRPAAPAWLANAVPAVRAARARLLVGEVLELLTLRTRSKPVLVVTDGIRTPAGERARARCSQRPPRALMGNAEALLPGLLVLRLPSDPRAAGPVVAAPCSQLLRFRIDPQLSRFAAAPRCANDMRLSRPTPRDVQV
jgi:hypothetical protein